MDDRNGNWDIYLYDIATQNETQITNNTADQFFPAIYGNTIVWQDNRNDPEGIILTDSWEIYSYDLVTHTETRRTFSSATSSNQNPVISSDRIVYVKTEPNLDGTLSAGIWEVYLSGAQEIIVESNRDYPYTDLPHPSIFGNYWVYELVYVDEDGINWRSAIKYWSHGFVSDEYHKATYPDIDDMYIVWQQLEDWTNWEIYLYRLDTGTVTRVTNHGANQLKPVVSEGRIVYQDNRNGNWDIYLSKVGYMSSATPPPTSPVPGGNATSGNGSLYIASIPSNATILINGSDTGIATNSIVPNIPAGNQNLTLIKEGYLPYSTVVNVPDGGIKVLASITLAKGSGSTQAGSGSLYVVSYPSNATILINGTDTGAKTNTIVRNVGAGNQNLTLTKDGYEPYSKVVTVPAGGMKVLAPITLIQGSGSTATGTGTLYVASYPSNATILINGTDTGVTTNAIVRNVPAGNQNLTLTKDGYEPYSTMVTVPAGGIKVLASVTLSPTEQPEECTCHCPLGCLPGSCICIA
jgi:beta propeller repeat protein